MKRLAVLAVVFALAACASPTPAPPAAVKSAAPAASLPAPVALPEPSDPPPPDVSAFADADVVVPSWPARGVGKCPAGRIHVGKYAQFVPASPGKTVINVMAVVPVDFDRDGKDDYAAYLMCGEGPEAGGRMVVGYRLERGVFQPIARIVGTQDGFEMMDYLRRKGNGIEVLVARDLSDSGMGPDAQWRTYELRDGRFRMVGVPAARPVIHLIVEPEQIVMRTAGSVRFGTLRFTVRNDSTAAAPGLKVQLQLPESFQAAGSSWTGCTAGSPGVLHCPLADIPAGRTVDVSYEILGPLPPMTSAPEMSVTVRSESIEVSDESTFLSTPLDVIFL